MRTQRREFIKTSVVAGSVIGLAGCLGDDGDDTTIPTDAEPEDDIEYEEVDAISWLTLSREDNPAYFEEADQVQGTIEELGFSIDEEVMESGAWVDTLFEKDYDIANLGWSNTVERLFPYYNLYFSFHSNYAEVGAGNFSQWAQEEYDEAVEAFASEMELEQRQELAHQCQEILAQNVPVAYTTHPSSLAAHNTDLYTGWEPMIGEWAYFNPTTLKTGERQTDDDTIVFGATSPPEQYPNFMSHTGPEAVFLHKLNYDPLVQMDVEGEPIAEGAAEDWEIVDDTTIDVTLREGMTWHDGEPVTPEDVKFTWDYGTEHGIPYLESDMEPYESSEILDDNIIRFNLSDPFAGFIQISLYRLPILPEHIWGGIVEEEDLDHPGQWNDPDMTGSGPFQFETYEPGNRIVFEKYEDHYAADEYDFNTLVYNIYGTGSAAVGDLINGDVTFTQGLGVVDWSRADDDDITEAIENPSIATNGLFFNTDNHPFSDVRVRQAIAYATNNDDLVATVHQGYGEPAISPVAPGNEQYHNPDVERYEYDIDQAFDMLIEVGFRYDDGELVIPVDWEPEVEYVNTDA